MRHKPPPATEEDFSSFLAWLHPDPEIAATLYLELHEKLHFFFAARRCLHSDELADRTIDRCIQKLREDETLAGKNAVWYAKSVAIFIEKEYWAAPRFQPLDFEPVCAASEGEKQGVLGECLQQCLNRLPPEERNLILDYYEHEKSDKIQDRRGAANLLDKSPGALRIKMFRIRRKLAAWVEGCLGGTTA